MKPVSFIGYFDGLQKADALANMGDMLQTCVDSTACDGAFYIFHYPESEDLKEHLHVLFLGECCQKSRALAKIIEIAKPHLTLPRQSKISDWLLYSIHDEDYLRAKNLQKKWHYRREEVHSTDDNLLCAAWSSIADDSSLNDVRNRIQHVIRSGGSVNDAVISANPRPNEVFGAIQYAKLYKNNYDEQLRTHVVNAIEHKIKEKEEQRNGKFQPEQNDEYYRAVQLQLEEFFRTRSSEKRD